MEPLNYPQYNDTPFNEEESFSSLSIQKSASWAVRETVQSPAITSEWMVFRTIRKTKGTSWSVANSCRGMKLFDAMDPTFSPESGRRIIQNALVAQITTCQLTPGYRAKSTLVPRGKFLIIAQTRDLYMDERGYIYYKNSEMGFLGIASSVNPDRFPTYREQIIALKKVL